MRWVCARSVPVPLGACWGSWEGAESARTAPRAPAVQERAGTAEAAWTDPGQDCRYHQGGTDLTQKLP